MERVRLVLIRNIDQKILFNKQKIVKLDERYASYCKKASPNNDFCNVNYYLEKDKLNNEIIKLENKQQEIYRKTTLSIVDTEI